MMTFKFSQEAVRWLNRCACAVVAMTLLFSEPGAAASPGVPTNMIVPRNVSYWSMFSGATLIVKLVMILLLTSSIVTWTIWISKTLELRSAKRRLTADIHTLSNATLFDQVGKVDHGASNEMLQVARAEISRTGKPETVAAAEGLKDRVSARLFTVENNVAERVLRGTNVLATVGAIAPFVGLFGTVWGIMNSFIGISQSHTTNLAVVAPGIAEALLATAMGLVAAIPAVIMYNQVARAIGGYRRQLSEAATNVACLFSHHVDLSLNRDPLVRAA